MGIKKSNFSKILKPRQQDQTFDARDLISDLGAKKLKKKQTINPKNRKHPTRITEIRTDGEVERFHRTGVNTSQINIRLQKTITAAPKRSGGP